MALITLVCGCKAVSGLPADGQSRDHSTPSGAAAPQTSLHKGQPLPSGATPRQNDQPLADDTIIVSLRSGADKDKVKELLDDVGGAVVKTLHVNADDYDILLIKPAPGKEEETIEKIGDQDKKDRNFKLISRNYRRRAMNGDPPNDTYYAQQSIELMHFSEARALAVNLRPIRTPVVYDLDTGCNTDAGSTPSDLPNVVVYDFLSPNWGLQIPAANSDPNGHGTGVCEIMADVTNNNYQTTGLASFSQDVIPKMVECRCNNSSDFTSDAEAAGGITFILNHLSELGGPGPINISAGPYYNDSIIRSFAPTVYKQGCILLIAACNFGSDITGAVPNPMPNGLAVVQATNTDGETRASWSNFANGDPVVAPGITVIRNDAGFAGTSIATPMVSGSVALLMSMFNITGQQALNVLLATGTNVNVSPNISWVYHDPKIMFRLDSAIASLRNSAKPPVRPQPIVSKKTQATEKAIEKAAQAQAKTEAKAKAEAAKLAAEKAKAKVEAEKDAAKSGKK